jgi:hypothetical protein
MGRLKKYDYEATEPEVHNELLQPYLDEGWDYDADDGTISREAEVLAPGDSYQITVAIRSGERTAIALKHAIGEALEGVDQVFINGELVDIVREDRKIETTSFGFKKGDVVEVALPKKVKKEEVIPVQELKVETYDDIEYTPEGKDEVEKRIGFKKRHIFRVPEVPPTGNVEDWPAFKSMFDGMKNIRNEITLDSFINTEVRSLKTGTVFVPAEEGGLTRANLQNPDQGTMGHTFSSELMPFAQKKLTEWGVADENR